MGLTVEDINRMIGECRAAAARRKIADEDSEEFINAVSLILHTYREHLGEDCEIKYRMRRRLNRAEIMFVVKGDRCDPFETGNGAEELRKKKMLNSMLPDLDLGINYRYYAGYNIITVRSARRRASSNIIKQPMVLAAAGGIIAGLICAHLPESANIFIVNEVTKPVLSTVLGIMMGCVGPVVFLSIVRAISSLDSIDEFTDLGPKIMNRFLSSTICIAVFSVVVAVIFFPVLGEGTVDFDAGTIIEVILEVIPTGLVAPFAENNIPQLVILGLGMGVVLLKMGESAKGLKEILSQLFQWIVNLLYAILVIIPVIPFLSIFNIVAEGETGILLKGWKYIVAAIFCMAVCVLVKFIKVSVCCKTSIPVIWKKMRPVVMKVFSTGVSATATKMNSKVCREEFGIDPEFSSLWVPLSKGILNPSSAVIFVMAPFLVASITGTPVSKSFILILLIMAVEISMASLGQTAGHTAVFKALGMSADYVGMFTVFNIVLKNFSAACTMAYRILEHIEIAYKTDHIDPGHLEISAEND